MKWLLILLMLVAGQDFDTDCNPDAWGLAVALSGEPVEVKHVATRAEWTEGILSPMAIPPAYVDTTYVRVRVAQNAANFVVVIIEDAVTDSVHSVGVLTKAHECGYHTTLPNGTIIFEPLVKGKSGYDFKKVDY